MITKSATLMALLAIASGAACSQRATTDAVDESQLGQNRLAAKIERGRYLVDTGGCHDCHTPLIMGPNGPVPDTERMLSGHPETLVMPPSPELPDGPWLVTVGASMTAWNGPWGTSFTANLTPDPDTGLGRWTEKNFIDTIRTGRRMGMGRPILPPMPIPVVQNYTDEDLAAIFAYLQSLKPLRNHVPEPIAPAKVSSSEPTPNNGDAIAISRN